MFLSRLFRSLTLLCLGGMAMHAGANGGVWDTPQRAAGYLLQPSSRLSLLREELDLRLGAASHAVSVRYLPVDERFTCPSTSALRQLKRSRPG